MAENYCPAAIYLATLSQKGLKSLDKNLAMRELVWEVFESAFHACNVYNHVMLTPTAMIYRGVRDTGIVL